ncbi:hypothetical protein [Zhongshania aliphaticivorans]|uniref:hypothetical protein n=1 Tax=Zhongshania aliphaticivorans TaxID=1470434 RepID=UPI0012E3FA8C|nr:hypothetical protein [Zhongshania aliphaticivorans]CAA0094858.1 Uncharacterised protein [Zhongshania aliphaticivorans]
MNKLLSNKGLLALTFSASLALTGCGGGGGGGGGSSSSGNGGGDGGGSNEPLTTSYSEVEGPLDAVQQPLSEQVLAPIVAGAAGTPLEGPVSCVTSFVVTDVLDVLDSVLANVDPATLSNPAALFGGAAANFQATVTELAADLPIALASLAGEECTGGGSGGDSSDPLAALAGTPLEPLAQALAPVLAMANGGGSGEAPSPSVLLAQLSTAFSEGLAAIVAQDPTGQIGGAPVLGGLLTTLEQALGDLSLTAIALEDMDVDATSAALSVTVENLLNGLLIDVVPIGFIEEQSGQGPIVSSQIQSAVASLTGLLGGGFGGLPAGGFGSPADALFGPLSDTFLASLQSALAGGLAGGGAGSNVGGFGALLEVLAPLQALLSGGGDAGGDDGLTGTPLDILLSPLMAAIDGGAGACPLAGTPLDALCSVSNAFTGALAQDGDADLLGVLQGLLGTLLGGLQP